jgi:hypothetical protein
MAYAVADLLKMSQAELDALYTASPPGPIPDGQSDGTVIIAPGTVYTAEIAALINIFAWQGKVFDAKTGLLRNRILPMGINAIVARVSEDTSWLDGKPCVLIDYSETSIIAHWVRDEMRMIQPDTYLGVTYWDKARLIHFVLQF